MPALYHLTNEDGDVLNNGQTYTFGEAESECRKAWANGSEVYMTPANKEVAATREP